MAKKKAKRPATRQVAVAETPPEDVDASLSAVDEGVAAISAKDITWVDDPLTPVRLNSYGARYHVERVALADADHEQSILLNMRLSNKRQYDRERAIGMAVDIRKSLMIKRPVVYWAPPGNGENVQSRIMAITLGGIHRQGCMSHLGFNYFEALVIDNADDLHLRRLLRNNLNNDEGFGNEGVDRLANAYTEFMSLRLPSPPPVAGRAKTDYNAAIRQVADNNGVTATTLRSYILAEQMHQLAAANMIDPHGLKLSHLEEVGVAHARGASNQVTMQLLIAARDCKLTAKEIREFRDAMMLVRGGDSQRIEEILRLQAARLAAKPIAEDSRSRRLRPVSSRPVFDMLMSRLQHLRQFLAARDPRSPEDVQNTGDEQDQQLREAYSDVQRMIRRVLRSKKQ